jgi:uncharacterized protein
LELRNLLRVEKAEDFLLREGFHTVRGRDLGSSARLEVAPGELHRLTEETLRVRLLHHLKSLGYTSVSVDLEGYRTGKVHALTTPEDS